MNKKSFSINNTEIKKYSYPILVFGSGIAGLYSALRISEKGLKVALITKSKLGESNTRYAQGGVAVVLPENSKDSIDLHVKDTLEAGAGLSDPAVTRLISTKGAHVINKLINYGVPFDKGSDNQLALTLEGAHSVRRVLHSGGDATGRNIEKRLVELVEQNSNIDVFEEFQVVELLVDNDNTCHGAIVFDASKNLHYVFVANYTVLATGGLSQVYLNTTNPAVATGDGVALAYKAGANIMDMEFVQFHPTAFHDSSTPKFLISESVRGEGAKLRNLNGELFAHHYDPKADLAPRDIVTRAIFSEMNKTSADHVFLDATQIPENVLENRFPNIILVCLKNGIDIKKDYIPVSPAAHYSMGGIQVNLLGKTSINKLYAVGEVACTGLHGANRLASNSLLECVVLAEEVACNIVSQKGKNEVLNIDSLYLEAAITEIINNYSLLVPALPVETVTSLTNQIQNTMWSYAGVVKNQKSLEKCLEIINNIEKEFKHSGICSNLYEYELRNLIIIAKLITLSALQRKESRGAHYRDDFLDTNNQAVHSILTTQKDKVFYEFSSQQNYSRQLCPVYS